MPKLSKILANGPCMKFDEHNFDKFARGTAVFIGKVVQRKNFKGII